MECALLSLHDSTRALLVVSAAVATSAAAVTIAASIAVAASITVAAAAAVAITAAAIAIAVRGVDRYKCRRGRTNGNQCLRVLSALCTSGTIHSLAPLSTRGPLEVDRGLHAFERAPISVHVERWVGVGAGTAAAPGLQYLLRWTITQSPCVMLHLRWIYHGVFN